MYSSYLSTIEKRLHTSGLSMQRHGALIPVPEAHADVLVPPTVYSAHAIGVCSYDVTSCIVAALCSVRQSVSRVVVSQSVSSSRLGAAVVGISEISW